jgi:hypothetical protein
MLRETRSYGKRRSLQLVKPTESGRTHFGTEAVQCRASIDREKTIDGNGTPGLGPEILGATNDGDANGSDGWHGR